MNETIQFLLAGDKFMSETHFRQPAALGKPGFTSISCGSFTKNKERIQKFKIRGDSRYIYQNELDKECFQHGIAYCNFKDLPIRITFDSALRVKHLIMLKIQNMMDIEELLLQWFIIF